MKTPACILCVLFSCSGTEKRPDVSNTSMDFKDTTNRTTQDGNKPATIDSIYEFDLSESPQYSKIYLNQVNMDLPFGCMPDSLLIKSDIIQNLMGCLSPLNNVKLKKRPILSKIEFVKIGNNYYLCSDPSMFPNDFKFRLPDLGPYQCYYLFGHFTEEREPKTRDHSHDCQIYGNLLLYDSTSTKTKVLNVHSRAVRASSFYSEYRFFYLDNKKVIHVFDIERREDQRTIRDKFTIKISPSGDISVLQQ